MDMLFEISQAIAFSCALYVAGAAICRLRVPNIATRWVLLYMAVFGNALWCLYDLIEKSLITRDVVMIVCIAFYIFLTRKKWAHGVPDVARRVG